MIVEIEKRISSPFFRYVRLERTADAPPADRRIVDVALLDMNHLWPNLGHDSLVEAVAEIAEDLGPLLEETGIRIRVLSFDVRHSRAVPLLSEGGPRLFLGTGGPGHIDPYLNDGVAAWAQGVREDPAWERPFFDLLDSIVRDESRVFLGICHSFGVVCRWAGVATPVLRGPEKGGKSSGVRTNRLSAEAQEHPWFRRFADELPDGWHLKVLDSRLFDLVPTAAGFPRGVSPIAYESTSAAEDPGRTVTMIEFARDRNGRMPRFFAVNHHPEVRGWMRQRRVLDQKSSRGEVTREWIEERERTLREAFSDPDVERQILLTAQFTLIGPLRFHVFRLVRQAAESLGIRTALHEDQILDLPSGTLDREPGSNPG